MLELGFY
jgi:hypothetical protein